jgi:tetratricopeptide (TPR) repeat protein
LCALALLAACQSEPRLARPAADAAAAAPAATRPVSDNAGATDAPAGGTQPGAAASGALVLPATATRQAPGGAVYISGPTTVPEAAARQYSEALDLMKAGRSRDAELQLKQLSAAYPGLSGPEVNLGLLYLQGSKLPQAETAFKTALVRNPANAAAAN